uniref:TSA: Wollemia nobilis Ref_Wollemi_Transcript_7974_1677 transcribed RNA sequence n=1 Tax=Wollemia nobilis TaxID=56998 RepID=A0A0C9S9E5_9CONI
MEGWGLSCPNSHQHSLLNFHCSCDPLLWNTTMAASSESVLITQSLNGYPELPDLKIEKEQWTQFLADGNEDDGAAKMEKKEEKGKSEGIVNSQVAANSVGSSLSGSEEQHSEICVEDQQSELSDDSGSKKSSEGETVDSKSKKRKRSTERGPKYAFKTRSETEVLEDGFKWRKYGRKSVKSSPHPRSYYRCSDSNCHVKKRVERDPSDPEVLITTYEGKHNHESPSVIYYIGKPIVLQQPGSRPAIVIVNAGPCP